MARTPGVEVDVHVGVSIVRPGDKLVVGACGNTGHITRKAKAT